MSSMRSINVPDADIILLSGDSEPIPFYLHRCILSAASPFFKDMFSLPQKDTQPRSTVPAQEPASTLDPLLQFIYPVPDPKFDSLSELSAVLDAAVKYDFVSAISALRKHLVLTHFLESEPTRVYAIACRYDFEEEAKIASRYTLSVNVLDCPLSDDLKFITAYSYHRLLDLHRRRARAAQHLLVIPSDIKCMQCNGNSFSVYGQPKWWYEFEKRAKEELVKRPTTELIFSMEFLCEAANAVGCVRCPGSVLDSHKFLRDLKRSIDDLPDTI